MARIHLPFLGELDRLNLMAACALALNSHSPLVSLRGLCELMCAALHRSIEGELMAFFSSLLFHGIRWQLIFKRQRRGAREREREREREPLNLAK